MFVFDFLRPFRSLTPYTYRREAVGLRTDLQEPPPFITSSNTFFNFSPSPFLLVAAWPVWKSPEYFSFFPHERDFSLRSDSPVLVCLFASQFPLRKIVLNKKRRLPTDDGQEEWGGGKGETNHHRLFLLDSIREGLKRRSTIITIPLALPTY